MVTASSPPGFPARRWPMAPAIASCPTLILTGVAREHVAVFEALQRDPEALLHGEIWRLLSPVLVQADIYRSHGVWRALAVLSLVAAVLLVAERAFGLGRTLLLYVVGALVGHGVGALWQPFSSGCSVAGCGVLGGLAAWLVRASPPQVRFGAASVLALGLVGALLRDIHGPPVLAGALVAWRIVSAVPLPEPLAGERRAR